MKSSPLVGRRVVWPLAAACLAGCAAGGPQGLLGNLLPQTATPAPAASGSGSPEVAREGEEGPVVYVDPESLTLTVPLAAMTLTRTGQTATSLDTAMRDVGRLLVGLFDYGNFPGSVAPFGFAIEGAYRGTLSTKALEAGGAAPYFGFPTLFTLSVPAVIGMAPTVSLAGAPTASAFFTSGDATLNYMGLGTARDIRRESRRYLVRDFLDGASLATGATLESGKSPSVSFRNLPLTAGQSTHRYLLFAVAYDRAPNPVDARILGYTEQPLDPKLLGPGQLGKDVVLDPMTLTLDNDLLKTGVKAEVTVVYVAPTMEDGELPATPLPKVGSPSPLPGPSPLPTP